MGMVVSINEREGVTSHSLVKPCAASPVISNRSLSFQKSQPRTSSQPISQTPNTQIAQRPNKSSSLSDSEYSDLRVSRSTMVLMMTTSIRSQCRMNLLCLATSSHVDAQTCSHRQNVSSNHREIINIRHHMVYSKAMFGLFS